MRETGSVPMIQRLKPQLLRMENIACPLCHQQACPGRMEGIACAYGKQLQPAIAMSLFSLVQLHGTNA